MTGEKSKANYGQDNRKMNWGKAFFQEVVLVIKKVPMTTQEGVTNETVVLAHQGAVTKTTVLAHQGAIIEISVLAYQVAVNETSI